MLKLNKLYIEPDRFYVSMPWWIMYAMLVVIGILFCGVGIAGFSDIWNDMPRVLAGLFLFLGSLSLIGCFAQMLGIGIVKDYRGRLLWGADAHGIFLLSPEEKTSCYDWSRISRVVLAQTVYYQGDLDDSVVNQIYMGNLGGREIMGKVTRSNVILFYIDRMNEMETKAGKIFYSSIVSNTRVLASSYHSSSTETIRILRKYAPSHLSIERKQDMSVND